VLNGVGGRTIAEAKRCISYAELLDWARYRSMRGTLNVGLHVERGAALQAAMFANVNYKKGGYTLLDFAPHLEEPELSLEEAMESWR
jgi:hypothetical protein